jgi:hypothetical protein|tara:strand:- start:204 stop:377 length:174 start_codon:yes stop_codon:yes gene_type:complete
MSDFNRDIARAINIEASALFGLSDSNQLRLLSDEELQALIDSAVDDEAHNNQWEKTA